MWGKALKQFSKFDDRVKQPYILRFMNHRVSALGMHTWNDYNLNQKISSNLYVISQVKMTHAKEG